MSDVPDVMLRLERQQKVALLLSILRVFSGPLSFFRAQAFEP
jgi:hypothetical protein